MKSILFVTTLLFALLFATSCRTGKDQAARDFYNRVNKYSTLESRLIRDNRIGRPDAYPRSRRVARPGVERVYNASSEQAYQEQVAQKSNEFKVLYDGSEVANGDVYREAAAHRQKLIGDCNCGTTNTGVANTVPATPATKAAPVTVATTKTAATPQVAQVPQTPQVPQVPQTAQVPQASQAAAAVAVEENQTPAIFAHLLDAEKRPIRRVKVRFINDSDQALLKQYSVVIAALSKQAGVERIKKAFAVSGEDLFFVKNEVGLYYVIVGSYDAESEATEKIRRLQMQYTNLYSPDQLFNKYGVTFADMWILRK